MTITALGGLLVACSKMDATYEKFLKDGEHVYRELPDSLKVFPGHNRIGLSWLLPSNPNVVKCKVFWNNGKDSVEIPVVHGSSVDTVSTIITGLAEGSYTFVVYTYDKAGNSSVPTDTLGQVYGDAYISSLANRLVQRGTLNGDNVKILWYKVPEGRVIGTELSFKDQDGKLHTLLVAPDGDTTRFNIHPQGDSLRYRTLYIPDSLAIDTFYTAYASLTLEPPTVVMLDKSNFKEFKLPTDALLSKYSTGMPSLWDDSLDSKHFYGTNTGSGSPHWFTFDMGAAALLDHYTIWQRGIDNHPLFYANANMQHWEVWGSNDPAEDGSWDGWVKLMDCTSVKPSGLPLGQLSDEDIAQAEAGETFTFPKNIPEVRYIRIKVLGTWDPKASDHALIAELSMYGIAE